MLLHSLLVLLGVRWTIGGQIYTFLLSIKDRLHEDWIVDDVHPVTRIECATFCYQRGNCSFFGFKNSHCLLLKDTLDGCTEDECPESLGMKIYELRKEPIPTTTPPVTTEETTTLKPTTPIVTTESTTTTTTTTKPTTTSTQKPTTTEKTTTSTTEQPTTTVSTTEEPTTTKAEKPTTPEPITSPTPEPITSPTPEPITSPTPEPITSPTPEPITSPTPEPITSPTPEPITSPTPEPITSPTPEPTISTATEQTMTMTEQTTSTPTDATMTTTGATSTTTEGKKFSCDPPDGAEAKAECPLDTQLLNALGSKSPFFGDALSPKCYDFKENIYDKSVDDVHYFFSVDGGITINAQCPGKHEVVVQYSLCVIDAHIPAIVLHCSPIKDPDRIKEVFNVTSEPMKDTLVNCDSKAGFQKMFFKDADGKGVVTRITYQCLLFDVPDNEVDSTLGDKKPDEVG